MDTELCFFLHNVVNFTASCGSAVVLWLGLEEQRRGDGGGYLLTWMLTLLSRDAVVLGLGLEGRWRGSGALI
jgi:hypothetical protein